jgi:hypothetical protein
MKIKLKISPVFFEDKPKLKKILNRQGAFFTDQIKKKILLAPPRTGEHYRRGKTAVHIASAPGEPPAIDSGNLVNSFQWEVEFDKNLILSSSKRYAEFLELDKNRPFFIGTIAENLNNLRDALKIA